MANDCRTGWKNSGTPQEPQRSQQQQPQKKSQPPKKKYNPTQMRQYIRAIIDENYEEGDPEYDDFIKEATDLGF